MAPVLLLRHGQSTMNAEGRWQGWADPPLSPVGEAQARAAADHLRDEGLTTVVSSDLQRARRTAEIVAGALGLGPVEVVPELRERDVGGWSGLTMAEIDERWPGQVEAWRAGRLERPGGNGEARHGLEQRVMTALASLLARPDDEVILAVTHGGVIHAVERRIGAVAGGTGLLCGRWVRPGLEPGERVELPESDSPTVTTVL